MAPCQWVSMGVNGVYARVPQLVTYARDRCLCLIHDEDA